jgi:hypothetical protein
VSVAVVKTSEAFPNFGTALLCASGAREAAQAPEDDPQTMFSGALLAVLGQGDGNAPPMLSLRDVGLLTERLIKDRFPNKAVRPEVHSPDQSGDGDIALTPLFPNPARNRAATKPASLELADQGKREAPLTSQDRAAIDVLTSVDSLVERARRYRALRPPAWGAALYAFERALTVGGAATAPRRYADILEAMAEIHWSLGDVAEAREFWNTCLRVYERLFPRDRAALADRITAAQRNRPGAAISA